MNYKIERPIYITRKEIAAILKVTVSTVFRYTIQPDFPKGFKFSPGRVVWLLTEVLAWANGRRLA